MIMASQAVLVVDRISMNASNPDAEGIRERHLSTLGLPCGALPHEIRDARRRLALIHHPDRGGDAGKMSAVNEATVALLSVSGRPLSDSAIPGHQRVERVPVDTTSLFRTLLFLLPLAFAVPLILAIAGLLSAFSW